MKRGVEPGGRLALRRSAGHRHLRDATMSAISAPCPPTFKRILDETAKDVPRGSSVVCAADRDDDVRAYQQLFVGIALAVVLIYLLIVVNFQSWLDPFVIVERAADRARRHRLDAVRHAHDAVGSRAYRGDHVHGRGDREQHSGRQLRARASGRRRRRRDRCDGGGLHAVPAGADDRARDDHRHGADGAERRAERAARPRRDRRPDLLDDRDAVLRAGGVPARSRAQDRAGRASRRPLSI